MIDPRNPDYANTPISAWRPRFHYVPADASAAPQVTIVTPFYNTGPLFHETAQCVLRQSFQQWEWLIVNDASTNPQALQLLQQYRHRDPRIRVIDHPVNRGLSGARNTGFQEARCEQVFILDDDDLIEPTTVEKTLWHLAAYPEFSFANGWSVAFGTQEYLWSMGFEQRDRFLTENLAVNRSLIRKAAHARVGGFDESIRGGMEDWDFWLRCADHGLWGATIPEYFDWYRRRDNHTDRWPNLQNIQAFVKRLRDRYPRLYNGGFPQIERHTPAPHDPLREALPCTNPLQKRGPRLLLIVPWLTTGGADKFNLDLVAQVSGRGWEVTIATTLAGKHDWLPEFARHTPDIFALHNFLPHVDRPVFLRYLIESRRPDVVLTTNSEFGYQLLPYLRTFCPEPAYVDFCHSDTINWKSGGYPRYAVANQELLDLNIVASRYLKNWMLARGADPERIEISYINVDAERWAPCPQTRRELRAAHAIAEDQPLVFFAGRLHADKQPQVLAQVLRHLDQRGLDFHAAVAGDGPDRPWLEQYISEHGLEKRVTLLGDVSSDHVREWMAASDIFFLPSLWEGIALTIYEAMACGLALIGADVGGQSELVTPECGLLLPKGTEEEKIVPYADRLAQLIANPARRATMGQRARARICEAFTLDKMGERMTGLFEKARQWRSQAPRPALSQKFAMECATQAVEQLRLAGVVDKGPRLEQQCRNMQHAVAERERVIEELRQWLAQLEQGKDWLETQYRKYQTRIEEQEGAMTELRGWAQELQNAKAWHEGVATQLQDTVSEQQAWIAHLEQRTEALSAQLQRCSAELERERTTQMRLRDRCATWKQQRVLRALSRAKLLRELTLD